MVAKRMVADRCLYGVDKNHLAVEMAKLSLWLVTLGKNRPFTFLDHALRHGDSLIGTDEDEYDRWWHALGDTSGPLYAETNREAKQTALRLRRELWAMPLLDVRDAAAKERLLTAASAATARIRRACDLLAGVKLLGLKKRERDGLLAKLLIEHTKQDELVSDGAQQALAAARQQHACHWPFEFPEVFAQGGYSLTSIRERIYSREATETEEAMAGILIYTAADSEGTLGGLVNLGRPETLNVFVAKALETAEPRICLVVAHFAG